MGQESLFGAFWGKKEQLLSEIPKKSIAAAYCSTLAAYRPKMQHIGFFIESCIKWAENDYLGHFIIGEGNYYPYTKKNPTAAAYCCILAAYRPKCCILFSFIKNYTELIQIHYPEHFLTKNSNYYTKIWKMTLLLHAAAYRSKLQHIGFFSENFSKLFRIYH